MMHNDDDTKQSVSEAKRLRVKDNKLEPKPRFPLPRRVCAFSLSMTFPMLLRHLAVWRRPDMQGRRGSVPCYRGMYGRRHLLMVSMLLACMSLSLPGASSAPVPLRPCLRAAASAARASAADGTGATDEDGVALLLTEADAEAEAEENQEKTPDKTASDRRRAAKIPQPFKLDELIVQWDSWETSQVTERKERGGQGKGKTEEYRE